MSEPRPPQQNTPPAAQIELFDIPSPCVGICTADSRGFCKGCLRNRDERFNWLYFTNEEKREVIRKCSNRKKRIALAIYKQRLEKQKLADSTSNHIDDLFGN